MDFSCDIEEDHHGWFRGLQYPAQLFTALQPDFFIYVVGPLIRYVKAESNKKGTVVRVLKTMQHGFDGVAFLEANPTREVYALAEKTVNPRIHIYRIDRGGREPYTPRVVSKLSGIHATDIRAVRFNKKELVVVLTGYPSFSVSIWKWTTEQELMVALCNEPSTFSDLLINPINDCHWVEYGQYHMTFYDLQSFTKNDVIRTQIYLPQRQLSYDRPDHQMGQPLAMRIVSACYTALGDFYILDNHLGLHVLNQEDKVLNWLCSIGYSFLDSPISCIVPFADCIAEVRKDGSMLAYDIATHNGKLRIVKTFKLSSEPIKYWQFPGALDSFYAITDANGMVESVEEGKPCEPYSIPDLLFNFIRGVTFIEPKEEFCAILSDTGEISILDTITGIKVYTWKQHFETTSIVSHPVLPFLFCGTNTGCVLTMDISTIQKPHLICRTYLSKEPGAKMGKMVTVSQGRYLISADTTNDKLYLQYGYPFEDFEYLDSARIPGEIRHLNVPALGREDLRVQVIVYAKNKIEEICPTFVYNFALNNDRLTLAASQSIENPIGAIAMAQISKYLYTYHMDKRQIGITPYCDDNSWTVLQEPELLVETPVNSHINRMITHGERLYAFSADGKITVHEPPVEKQRDQPIPLTTLVSVQTHLFVDGGIRDGIVSLDGSLAVALGYDGTFTCVRLFEKPDSVPWSLLGFEKPKLVENQLACLALDQAKMQVAKPGYHPTHVVKEGESPAPEFWSKQEQSLLHKQHFPVAEKLREEFRRMIDKIYALLSHNATNEHPYQLEMWEFNLDDDLEELIEDKRTKYVQYCHLLCQARNKLRKDRISMYKNMVWEPFVHKGRLIMGFQTPTIVQSYPLKTHTAIFGMKVNQSIQERRIEMKIDSIEKEIVEEAHSTTVSILKDELEFIPQEHRQRYIKGLVEIDPNVKFETEDNRKKTDKLGLRHSVFQTMAKARASQALLDEERAEEFTTKSVMPSSIIKKSKRTKKSIIGFGGHVPPKKEVVAETATTPSAVQAVQPHGHKSQHRCLKKKKRKQTESLAKKRMLERRVVVSGDEGENEETGEEEEEETEGESGKRGKKRHGQDSDSDESYMSSVGPSRKDLLAKIKPSKHHMQRHGVFGPKRRKHGLRDGVQVLLEPDEAKSKRRRDRNRKKDEKGQKKKKRVRKVRSKDQFVIESESDPDVDDVADFEEIKEKRLARFDEEKKALYKNVERIFSGILLHELEEMYPQYKKNPYHHHQFELHSRHQLVRQIWLCFDELYRLKSTFNKMFDQARNYKVQTLKRMAERNERIRDLYYYLKLDLDILDDKLSPLEDPAQVFTVLKSEIPIERYLTAEQRAEEERLRLEAIARKNTRLAKFRRRALKVMMDNKLEIRPEEILVKEVPRPRFMDEKDPMEYSLEEYIASMEYKEACEELDKARAHLIKELQQELHTLYKANALDYNGIDQRLNELFLTRKQFHYNCTMTETTLMRISKLMRLTDDCQHEEDRVNRMLVKLQDGMKSTHMLVAQLTARRNECREKSLEIADRQKELEKRFRKELGDVGPYLEFFIKNYKRKPKISAKGLDRGEIYEKGMKALVSTNIRAFARENGDAAKAVVMAIMDIEDPMLMPAGCPRSHWDKFVKLRRHRLVIDFEMKSHSLEMKHISEGLEECKEREEETAKAMAAMLAILSHRTEMKNYFLYNTEFQYITGKGSIEIEFWNIEEHPHSVMTLAKNIERHNSFIAEAADGYIQDMRKTILVHRDVREIEWRFRVVHMALADVKQLIYDVNNSKPRKELLRVLKQGVNLETMYEDRMELVRYLQETSLKFQKVYLAARRRLKLMYQHQAKHQVKVNEGLKSWLKDENKSTSLLKNAGLKTTPEQRNRRNSDRVNKFLIKGFMVRKIHNNYQTINLLEGELARFYQRSYPCL